MDKKLGISLGVLTILVGLYFYDNSTQKSYKAGYTDIFTFDVEKIEKVIILKDSDGIELHRSDSTWSISGNDTMVVKQTSIDKLFDTVLKVKRSTLSISDNPEDLSIYSLSDSLGSNILFLDYDGNTLAKAMFGISPSNYYSNFYKDPDKPSVYQTNSNILTFVTTNPRFWGEVPKPPEVPENPSIDTPVDSIKSL